MSLWKSPDDIERIGEGSYGIVYKINNPGLTGSNQVIKRNIIEKTTSFTGSTRELDALMALREHPNIVTLQAVLYSTESSGLLSPLDREEFKDDIVHFIFASEPIDLLELMYQEELSYTEIRYFLLDILVACEYIHAMGYLHRDIKTANLLVANPNSTINRRHIKICDFGLSKPVSLSGGDTPRVVTGWYRSPDVCLGSRNYSYSVDAWSIGCVLYELLAGEALCENCDDDNLILLDTVFNGIPTECFGPNPLQFDIVDTITARGIPKEDFIKRLNLKANLAECGPNSIENLYNLLIGLLRVNPQDRLSTSQAIESPFFDPIRREVDITRIRYLGKIPDLKLRKYQIVECPERQWIISIAFTLFNEREKYSWYKHRILFQAISLMDRYLAWKIGESGSRPIREISGNNSTGQVSKEGRFHSQDGTILRFLSCLYMSMKYFTTIDVIVPFEIFAIEKFKSDISINFAGDFERILIEQILKNKFYLPTPYELIPEVTGRPLTEEETRDTLILYGKLKSFDGTLEDLTKLCRK